MEVEWCDGSGAKCTGVEVAAGHATRQSCMPFVSSAHPYRDRQAEFNPNSEKRYRCVALGEVAYNAVPEWSGTCLAKEPPKCID